jgi:hypothetical protein
LNQGKRTIWMRHKQSRGGRLSRQIAVLFAILLAANLFLAAQSVPSDLDDSKGPRLPTVLTPLKSQEREAPYRPITSQESLRWFINSTVGLPHRAGGVFVSAFGTALDRPKEYGPHWEGFGDRYGMRIACSATGNAMEVGAGLLLREDPRYFRVPDRPFRSRTENVLQLTFAARGYDGSFGPAYARYAASFGNNFLSNTWRVHSEANAQHALLRTAGDFAGRMAANAWEEFWPDVKKRVLHTHKRN